MPLTLADAEDAFVAGHMTFEEWHANFERQWYAPMTSTMVGMLLNRMDPGTLAYMRAQHPEAIRAAEELAFGRRAK